MFDKKENLPQRIYWLNLCNKSLFNALHPLKFLTESIQWDSCLFISILARMINIFLHDFLPSADTFLHEFLPHRHLFSVPLSYSHDVNA